MIALAGLAFAGKDTFVGIAKNILLKNDYIPIRIAFADELKTDIIPFIKEKYGIEVLTASVEEKKMIRPLLVAHGCCKRAQTNGKYWVDKLDDRVKDYIASNLYRPVNKIVFLCSDVRFANEVEWCQKSWNGIVIHLKRWSYQEIRNGLGDFDTVKVYDSPPNKEEIENDPIIQKMADYHVEWENAKKMTQEEAIKDPKLQEIVLDTLNSTKYFSGKLLK